MMVELSDDKMVDLMVASQVELMENMKADQIAHDLVYNLEYQSVEKMALEQEDQMAEKWEKLKVNSMVDRQELQKVGKQVVKKVACLVHYLVEQRDGWMDELWVDLMVEYLVERSVDRMVGMQAVLRAQTLVDSKALHSVDDLARLMDILKLVKQAHWMVGWLETMMVSLMDVRQVDLKEDQLAVGLVALQVIQTVVMWVVMLGQQTVDLSESQKVDWMIDWQAYQRALYLADNLVDYMVAWQVENLVYLQVVQRDVEMVDLMAEKQGAKRADPLVHWLGKHSVDNQADQMELMTVGLLVDPMVVRSVGRTADPMAGKKDVQKVDKMEVRLVVNQEPWSVDLMTESMVQLLVVEMVDKLEHWMVDPMVVLKAAQKVELLV